MRQARPKRPRNTSSACCRPGSLAMVSSTYARTCIAGQISAQYQDKRSFSATSNGTVDQQGRAKEKPCLRRIRTFCASSGRCPNTNSSRRQSYSCACRNRRHMAPRMLPVHAE